ncbi:hypothetical protein [Cellulomonas aerilata]|uniref:Uncharacterized protein n=1 Tax=Cellulomonas aerilata TaxID=515326 RepID=A0A512DDC9_9CELL|nr:hypothetical protein [Cellulomonas aerilata]GEO34471.1 hypothetical protein CAE01nite_21960 [Cellulomonas aerilata]
MTAVLPRPAGSPAWSAAWTDALAELEMSVDEAEALLRAAHTRGAVDVAAVAGVGSGWQPPTGLGQLPAPLVDRAKALLDRQVRVARQLAEAAAHSRRQLRAVEGMRATAESGPVYIDTAG